MTRIGKYEVYQNILTNVIKIEKNRKIVYEKEFEYYLSKDELREYAKKIIEKLEELKNDD